MACAWVCVCVRPRRALGTTPRCRRGGGPPTDAWHNDGGSDRSRQPERRSGERELRVVTPTHRQPVNLNLPHYRRPCLWVAMGRGRAELMEGAAVLIEGSWCGRSPPEPASRQNPPPSPPPAVLRPRARRNTAVGSARGHAAWSAGLLLRRCSLSAMPYGAWRHGAGPPSCLNVPGPGPSSSGCTKC